MILEVYMYGNGVGKVSFGSRLVISFHEIHLVVTERTNRCPRGTWSMGTNLV